MKQDIKDVLFGKEKSVRKSNLLDKVWLKGTVTVTEIILLKRDQVSLV